MHPYIEAVNRARGSQPLADTLLPPCHTAVLNPICIRYCKTDIFLLCYNSSDDNNTGCLKKNSLVLCINLMVKLKKNYKMSFCSKVKEKFFRDFIVEK